jgi:hypothetical protein
VRLLEIEARLLEAARFLFADPALIIGLREIGGAEFDRAGEIGFRRRIVVKVEMVEGAIEMRVRV